ncbi:MAG TPA: hypothetical protein VNA20_03475 [Frankiaceae bacterium]|nr:hypothetical protein [Frankiaceae bacterium]
MRKLAQLALSGILVLLAADPSTAAQGALEATWSDTGLSNTIVTESCAMVTAPSPYNAKCTLTATATNLSAPFRGQCTETLATAGFRRFLGPCKAVMSVTMLVNRVRADRQNPAAFACNGTTADQMTPGPEPVPLKGTFTYTNADGVTRQVPVDVNIVANAVKFTGSILRISTEEVLDEVDGRFPIRCASSGAFSGGYSGQYNFVI